MTGFEAQDWFVIAVYFALVFAVAIWATGRDKVMRRSSRGYFLAGRHAGWFVVGASIFASNIGSEHLVGLAGAGAQGGVSVAQFEILASLILLLLGWVFVPLYLRAGVFTMPEFLERRYGAGARWYLTMISVVGYVLTKISVTLVAGGIVLETFTDFNFWTGAYVVVVATGLYTVFGGMRAVLFTDVLQMIVLVGGALTVTWIGLDELGGWSELRASVDAGFFDMWKDADHPDYPWTGILFGAPILGVWYWCTDQFIVQRVLSARDVREARRGTMFAAALKILPVFIFVIPGMVAVALASRGQLDLPRGQDALPVLIAELLPAGARGLVVAGVVAALMSSLSSVFHSCSTLVTWDIYKKLRPEASDLQLVVVGQVTTIMLVALGLAWIPLMDLIDDQIYKYLQTIQAYLAPPIAAVFLLGVFSRRANGIGAMAALATGFGVGVARMILDLYSAGLRGGLLWFVKMNFLHFACGLFALCCAVHLGISLLTGRPDAHKLRDVALPKLRGPLLRAEAAISLGIIGLVATVWIWFSG